MLSIPFNQLAESDKRMKYSALADNYFFQPVGFETMGCWGADVVDFLAKVREKIADWRTESSQLLCEDSEHRGSFLRLSKARHGVLVSFRPFIWFCQFLMDIFNGTADP